MDLGLSGRRAVVTAASKGIGRAIALEFAREGASVAICARSEDALRRTERDLKALGVPVVADVCDVANPAELDAFLDRARASFGRIDILVNNATGYGFADDEAAWRASVDIDLMASVRACWKVVPWMTELGGGAIVHVASIAGLMAGPAPAYSAAKAAVVSHSKHLAVQLAPKKIRVNVVTPGSIFLPDGLWDQVKTRDPQRFAAVVSTIPSGRMGHPQEVASAVVFLCSDRASWITGACLAVDGGQHPGNV